jgi:hypothetical protein
LAGINISLRPRDGLVNRPSAIDKLSEDDVIASIWPGSGPAEVDAIAEFFTQSANPLWVDSPSRARFK